MVGREGWVVREPGYQGCLGLGDFPVGRPFTCVHLL